MSNKRPLSSTDQNDSSLTKKQKLPTLLDSLQQYFQYNDEEDQYIDEVAKYFNNLPDEANEKVNECSILPSANQRDDLHEGQQIHVNGYEGIYVIKSINGNAITISSSNNFDDTSVVTINQSQIKNVININPESLYIDPVYLSKINRTNSEDFDTTEDGILLKIKFYKSKINISKIKIKTYEITRNDGAMNDENVNLQVYKGKLNEAIQELSNRPLTTSINVRMNDIKNKFRGFYGINNASNVLNFFNNNILSLVFSGVDKDLLLQKYILFLDCISITAIAGAAESVNLVRQGINPTKGWIYTCISVFIKSALQGVPAIIKDTVTNYVLLPSITYYLYTNMDTLYLTANNMVGQINGLLTDALCVISNFNTSGQPVAGNDNETIATNETAVSHASNNTLNSIIRENSDLESVTSFYDNSQIVTDAIGTNESYGAELENNINNIITQPGSNVSSQQFPLSRGSSQESQESQSTINRIDGGKINRKTRKNKRMVIKRSKKTKKMSGGKKTKSTKKRRVVRRKTHHTKRR
jgi:hypothetical protein